MLLLETKIRKYKKGLEFSFLIYLLFKARTKVIFYNKVSLQLNKDINTAREEVISRSNITSDGYYFYFDIYFTVIAFSNHFLCLSITTVMDSYCLAVVIVAVHYLRTSTDTTVDSSLAFRFYRFMPL